MRAGTPDILVRRAWAFLRSPIFLAFIFFVAMTIIMTWPIVLRMGTSVVGQIGDNIYFIWLIHWFKKNEDEDAGSIQAHWSGRRGYRSSRPVRHCGILRLNLSGLMFILPSQEYC
jgi:hypothetical protein